MCKWRVLGILLATTGMAAELAPLPNFSRPAGSPQIVARSVPRVPWSVAGEYGALFGRQNGKFEAWQWPVKILSNFSIEAELADYPVPIDVNAISAEINVTPAETIITYSHAAFTIRQHMFAPRGSSAAATGAVVFFEIDSVRPLDLTFSFTPEMLRMWPAPTFGRPNGEWTAVGDGGVYVLKTDNAQFSAVVAMPRTKPGILVPYQEHPQKYPLQLKLSYDPKRDHGMVYPLLIAMSNGNRPYEQVVSINSSVAQLYAETQRYYQQFFDTRLVAETPDQRTNEALQWAEVAIDQMQVNYRGETGLVAGYYESGDSARPGFAWFFGRDTLWTAYAINSYGDFSLTRKALDFLIHRQRADGKIMHEFSQSADAVDWAATDYFYASADSTPLLIMAMNDYVKASGDTDYLTRNREAVRKAYAFTRAHESADGIYNNSQGTGWVESWPPGMPQQEIYLAALDQQSAEAMSHLAGYMNDGALSNAAHRKAEEIRAKIASEYYDRANDFYAFSRNADGSLDTTASIYPSVAWWDGTLRLEQAGNMLDRWASNEFSSDWGTRDISPRTPFYDPISYHQGSIWPLFTGWVSLAEYRAGRTLSGYQHLMQNVDLTWTQDLGSVTELLSGEFFQPLGRSTPHQMWSSAMVVTPMLRGLFGLEWDAPHHTLRVAPQMPADWEWARVRNVHVGSTMLDLEYKRTGGAWTVRAINQRGATICLATQAASSCNGTEGSRSAITIPANPIEIAVPAALPEEGATTSRLKVLHTEFQPNRAVFQFEAPAGSMVDLFVRFNRPHVTVSGAELRDGKLRVEFTSKTEQVKTIIFTW